MKKVLAIFVALLMIAGAAHAGAPPATAHINSVWVGGTGQPGTPIQEYVLVRYAKRYNGVGGDAPAITSGDVLQWEFQSYDGVTISIDTVGYGFAGVAVTAILTPDTTKVDLTEDNWGYMCIRGYCLANIDTSACTSRYAVVPNGNIKNGTFGTLNYYDTTTSGSGPGINSEDVGVLLIDNAADAVAPVWLR